MEITKKMQDALNEQVNAELHSAYMYLAMAAKLQEQNLSGASSWMKKQANEEMSHAMKIYGYVFERGGAVGLKAIADPNGDWKEIKSIFKAAYAHEQKITKLINGLVDLAQSEKDLATVEFLQWFVKEQVEEEDSARTIIDKLNMVGESKSALLFLDSELGKRE